MPPKSQIKRRRTKSSVRKPKRSVKTPVRNSKRSNRTCACRKPQQTATRNITKEYRPPENRHFMNVNSYKKYEKDIQDYKRKLIQFKNNKEVLKTLKWPDIHLYMTPGEIKRHREALLEYNKNYRIMTQSKIQFVLKVGLEPLQYITLNKKEVNHKIAKGLRDKKSKLWSIVTGSYFQIVDIIKEEYIGDNKVRITVVLHEPDPKRYIRDMYGALAPDGWQEGDIVLEDKYEVTLDLVSLKLLK